MNNAYLLSEIKDGEKHEQFLYNIIWSLLIADSFIFLVFWPRCTASGILVPQPGTEQRAGCLLSDFLLRI